MLASKMMTNLAISSLIFECDHIQNFVTNIRKLSPTVGYQNNPEKTLPIPNLNKWTQNTCSSVYKLNPQPSGITEGKLIN